jgi:hypothetical protein
MGAKSTGRVVALVLMTGVVGAVLVAALGRRAGTTTPINAPPPVDMGAPPQATNTVTDPGAGGSVQDLVSLAERGVWTRVDPESGRVVSRMTYARLDPLEAGRFEIIEPRAWTYDDGRVVEMRAERGSLVWPSRERDPESGTLTGGVVIEAKDGEGDDAPLVLNLSAPSLSFETALGELRTPDRVDVRAPGISARGDGLTLRMSSDRVAPISLMRIERGGSFEYDPAEARAAADRARERTPQNERTTQSTSDAADSVEFYLATLEGDVRAAAGDRTLEGERVTVFARTRGGRLGDDAVADFRAGPQANDAGAGARRDAGETSAAEPRENDVGDAADAVITLEWTGLFQLEPVPSEPIELANDDVTLMLEGAQGAPVVLADAATGGTLRAATLEYGATRRAVTASSSQGDRVFMDVPEMARLLASRTEIDLTTGVGVLEGPGQIVANAREASGASRSRGIIWNDRCDLSLDTAAGPVGSTARVSPKDIRFTGAVEAHDGGACLRGEMVQATFDTAFNMSDADGPLSDASSDGENDASARDAASSIRRLRVSGGGYASDEKGGSIRAEQIDVVFEPGEPGQDPAPTLATARGSVRAERGDESLEAGLLEARMERDELGEIALRTVLGRDGVLASLDRGGEQGLVQARADSMNADVRTGVVDLLGAPVELSRRGSDGVALVRGDSARIESAAARRLTMFGPGSAVYDAPRGLPGDAASDAQNDAQGDAPSEGSAAAPAPIASRVDVTWTGSLIYDDALGRAEISGAALATMHRGERERHTGKGDRIVVELTPAPTDQPAPPRRDLVRATITGDSAPAEVELRRTAAAPAAPVMGAPGQADADAAPAEPALESLAFLRGPSITMEGGAGALRVDGAGLLLLEDRRASKDDAGTATPASEPGASEDPAGEIRAAARDARGTTLFEWDGGMSLDRAQNRGEMRGNVRVRHRHLATGRIAEITADMLAATVREDEDREGGIALRGVDASGEVRAVYDALTVEGSRLVYDADVGTISVLGDDRRPVTAFDRDTGRSASGEVVIIELATGNWRVERASTITGPR